VRFGRVVAVALQGVGVLALLAAAAIGISLYGRTVAYEQAAAAPFTKSDLEFALNWAGVDKNQPWSIIASSRSARSFTGDHADFACIQLERFDLPETPAPGPWSREPETDPLLRDALNAALEWARGSGAECLPDAQQANSVRFVRYFRSVTFDDRSPAAGVVFLYDPAARRLYYIDFAT
jgi:hypothetical protein